MGANGSMSEQRCTRTDRESLDDGHYVRQRLGGRVVGKGLKPLDCHLCLVGWRALRTLAGVCVDPEVLPCE